MVGEIKAVLIFEMLGRPAEHLKNTLIEFVDRISKENEITNKEIHDPKRIEGAKQEIFSSFAELEIIFKDIPSIIKLIFTHLPSHIEILEPEEVKIKNFDLNVLMTELARRLHQYDEITKRLAVERSILQRQLQEKGISPIVPFAGQQSQPVKKEKKKAKKKK